MKKYRLIYQNSNIEVPKGRFDIGRSIECNLVLDDPSVSRVHGTIILEDDRLYLEDRGSRNGCLLNDHRITGIVLITDGDKISIGHQVIRVLDLQRIPNADRTLGLTTCPKCGLWIANNESACGNCGQSRASSDYISLNARATFKNEAIFNKVTPSEISVEQIKKTQSPPMMLAGLIKKSISMNRYEESGHLLKNMMESIIKNEQSGQQIEDMELLQITESSIALALATNVPQYISSLFAFYYARQKLMSRKSIELLYAQIRKIGYRACPEMSRYLALLADMSNTFSPFERFAHRRLEGLVGLCS